MALVSAHRGGAGGDHALENTVAAVESAIAAGCDYVEFDVQVTADGRAVLAHDAPADGDEDALSPVELDDVLEAIAGRIRAHVDLKFRGEEAAVVERILARIPVADVIITTAEDASVRRIRRWARDRHPGLLVGLSSSPRAHDGRRRTRWAVLTASFFPRLRVRLSGANLVVAHRTVARLWLRSYARRRGLPLVVWTVDEPAELTRWMNDPATWIVTTNYPARAFAARR